MKLSQSVICPSKTYKIILKKNINDEEEDHENGCDDGRDFMDS